MRIHQKIVSLLLAALMILSLSACGEGSSDEESTSKIQAIKDAGVLKLGTSADYPPYEFHAEVDGEDTIVGFEIAMAQKIADDLGVELEVTDMAFDALLISLQKGDFDMVMAGMSDNETRRQSAMFSDNIFSNEQIVIIRKEDEDKYVDIPSLTGVPVGAQTGSTQVEIASDAVGEENLIQLTKLPDLIMELQEGKIEAVFTNTLIAQAYTTTNEDLVVKDIGLDVPPTGFSIAVQKGATDFLDFCNQELADMKEAGLIEQYIVEAEVLAGMAEAEGE